MAGLGWQIGKHNAAGTSGIICEELADSEKKWGAIGKKIKDFWEKRVVPTIPDNGLQSPHNCLPRRSLVNFKRPRKSHRYRLNPWNTDDQPPLEFFCRPRRTPAVRA